MKRGLEYRQKVRECLEQAMERKGPSRHVLVAASRSWSRLAEEAEGFETLLAEWDDEGADASGTQAA